MEIRYRNALQVESRVSVKLHTGNLLRAVSRPFTTAGPAKGLELRGTWYMLGEC